MYNGKIRKIKIWKREGCPIFIKTLLKKSQIKIGDWVILKAKNLVNNKEIIFPANVRSNYRINIRKSIRSKLDLKLDFKTPIEFDVVNKLVKINLENKEISGISNNLIEILPSSLRINNQIIKLNCFEWQHNRLLFSYKNSKSSNYITLNKTFFFDPFIIGLWRAEGGKYSLTGSSLQFTNSNPEVIKAWLSFIHSLGFLNNDSMLFYYIQYISTKRDFKREQTLIKFWTEKFNIPRSKLRFIYKQGPGHKSKFYGSLHVKFNNSTLSFIVQYLFLKFEASILLDSGDKGIAIEYMKGTLCDADCALRKDSLHEVRWSSSCKEESELYKEILFKHFNIYSRIFPDKRNKCYYVRVGNWNNFLIFLKYNLFDAVSWKDYNHNYNKFRTGILNHLYSKIILCFIHNDRNIDNISNNLVKFKNLRKSKSFITLIKRSVNFLIFNHFIIRKDEKLFLSDKGAEVLHNLNNLCTLNPTG